MNLKKITALMIGAVMAVSMAVPAMAGQSCGSGCIQWNRREGKGLYRKKHQ